MGAASYGVVLMLEIIISLVIIASAAPVGAIVGIWNAKRMIKKIEREKCE